jgi:hypothetical protein
MRGHVVVNDRHLSQPAVGDISRRRNDTQTHALRDRLADRLTTSHLDGDLEAQTSAAHRLLEHLSGGRPLFPNDKSLLVEVRQTNVGPPRQRMVRFRENDQGLTPMLNAFQLGLVYGVEHHADITLMVKNPRSD